MSNLLPISRFYIVLLSTLIINLQVMESRPMNADQTTTSENKACDFIEKVIESELNTWRHFLDEYKNNSIWQQEYTLSSEFEKFHLNAINHRDRKWNIKDAPEELRNKFDDTIKKQNDDINKSDAYLAVINFLENLRAADAIDNNPYCAGWEIIFSHKDMNEFRMNMITALEKVSNFSLEAIDILRKIHNQEECKCIQPSYEDTTELEEQAYYIDAYYEL